MDIFYQRAASTRGAHLGVSIGVGALLQRTKRTAAHLAFGRCGYGAIPPLRASPCAHAAAMFAVYVFSFCAAARITP